MKKLLVAVIVVVAVGLAAAGVGWSWLAAGAQSAKQEGSAPPVTFIVAKGATGNGIGVALEEQHLIDGALFWKFHLWQRNRVGQPFKPKAGKHVVNASMTIPDIALALERAPVPEDEPFSMIEGWRLRDTDAALAAKGWSPAGAYIAATSAPASFTAPFPLPTTTLEGYLYPETYRVVAKSEDKLVFDVRALVQRQLDTFVTRFYEPHKDEIAKSGRTLDDIVKMASILEREEPVPAQRPLVAGILWKRIDLNFPLGVDASSRYELAEWNDRKEFLKHLRDPNDPYNTRLKTGLPPTPIGAPSVESLVAALRPVKSEFLYYLHDSARQLHPSRNAAEHEALRKKYNVY